MVCVDVDPVDIGEVGEGGVSHRFRCPGRVATVLSIAPHPIADLDAAGAHRRCTPPPPTRAPAISRNRNPKSVPASKAVLPRRAPPTAAPGSASPAPSAASTAEAQRSSNALRQGPRPRRPGSSARESAGSHRGRRAWRPWQQSGQQSVAQPADFIRTSAMPDPERRPAPIASYVPAAQAPVASRFLAMSPHLIEVYSADPDPANRNSTALAGGRRLPVIHREPTLSGEQTERLRRGRRGRTGQPDAGTVGLPPPFRRQPRLQRTGRIPEPSGRRALTHDGRMAARLRSPAHPAGFTCSPGRYRRRRCAPLSSPPS